MLKHSKLRKIYWHFTRLKSDWKYWFSVVLFSISSTSCYFFHIPRSLSIHILRDFFDAIRRWRIFFRSRWFLFAFCLAIISSNFLLPPKLSNCHRFHYLTHFILKPDLVKLLQREYFSSSFSVCLAHFTGTTSEMNTHTHTNYYVHWYSVGNVKRKSALNEWQKRENIAAKAKNINFYRLKGQSSYSKLPLIQLIRSATHSFGCCRSSSQMAKNTWICMRNVYITREFVRFSTDTDSTLRVCVCVQCVCNVHLPKIPFSWKHEIENPLFRLRLHLVVYSCIRQNVAIQCYDDAKCRRERIRERERERERASGRVVTGIKQIIV